MALKKFTNKTFYDQAEEVGNIILECLNTISGTDWSTIVEKVKEEFEVKNWMLVRSVLQHLLNNNVIIRIDSVHVEQYQLTTQDC